MILNLKRYISLLLVLMLLIGIVPTVNAAELGSESTLPEETVSEASEQTERAELTELTESTDNSEPTDPTEPTEPTEAPNEDPGEDDMELLAEADNAIMLAASTTSNVLLFDQASPNYTTYLSSQISVTYKPNGTDSSKRLTSRTWGGTLPESTVCPTRTIPSTASSRVRIMPPAPPETTWTTM